jgi:hypothetical protein
MDVADIFSGRQYVASTLAAMAMVCLAVGCVCSLEPAGGAVGIRTFKWYHPQTRLGALVFTEDHAAAIYNGAIDFCEGRCAPCIAHGGDNREKGVGRQAGDDMGC